MPICLLSILCLLFAQAVSAQPKAIGPDDLSRLRQQTEFSGDWSGTDAFDLERYTTLRVTIEKVEVPEPPGNAALWFSVQNPQKLTASEDLTPDRLFKATLQSVDTLERLELTARDFPESAQAILRGWPATGRNVMGSVLLIDDIQLTGSGRLISLHAHNPRMAPKRTSEQSPE